MLSNKKTVEQGNQLSEASISNSILNESATRPSTSSTPGGQFINDSSEEKPLTFPLKLMMILSNEEHKKIVSWRRHGKSFCIYNKADFANSVLPLYFKKTKFTSFTRKLHRWGFVRLADKGTRHPIYQHKMFKKDNVNLCTKMTCLHIPEKKRKRVTFANSHSVSLFQSQHHNELEQNPSNLVTRMSPPTESELYTVISKSQIARQNLIDFYIAEYRKQIQLINALGLHNKNLFLHQQIQQFQRFQVQQNSPFLKNLVHPTLLQAPALMELLKQNQFLFSQAFANVNDNNFSNSVVMQINKTLALQNKIARLDIEIAKLNKICPTSLSSMDQQCCTKEKNHGFLSMHTARGQYTLKEKRRGSAA